MKSAKDLEDKHTYMKTHNLTHYLAPHEIASRNMKSNGLNAFGLLSGINQPISEGTMRGKVNIFNNKVSGHGGHKGIMIKDIDSLTHSRLSHPNTTVVALSGHNTKVEPTAPLGVNQDRYFTSHFI